MSQRKSKQLRKIERQLQQVTPQIIDDWYKTGFRDGWQALADVLKQKYNIQVTVTPEAKDNA